MVSPVFLAALVTIVPAMGALFWFLHRYEDLFDDASIFFSLVVGFFTGLAASAFEFYTDFAGPASVAALGAGPAFLFAVVGYAFFETGIKTMALGLKRFRERKDTPYYGMALGIGFGAMLALMIVANGLRAAEAAGNPYQTTSFVAVVLIAVGAIFAHGATGAWVGQGSAEGKLWKGWGMGTLLQLPILGALWLWWPSIDQGNTIVWFPTLLSITYGSALLIITDKRVLAGIVPPEIHAQVRRDRRRSMRAAAGGAAGPAGAAAAAGEEE